MAQFPHITFSNVKHKVDLGSSVSAASRIIDGVIQTKDEDITPLFNTGSGSSYRASYNSPYNQITGNYTSDMELSRFEIRVNPIESDDYGPGIGNLADVAVGVTPNTSRTFTINITDSVFTGSSSNTYRICLLAQSSLDYSWDCTQVYAVLTDHNTENYKKFKLKNSSDYYEVHNADIIS